MVEWKGLYWDISGPQSESEVEATWKHSDHSEVWLQAGLGDSEILVKEVANVEEKLAHILKS
jgi:hypothetical protein